MTSNGYLGREGITGRNARRYRDVELPGGGKVRIRSLSELEKSDYETSFYTRKGVMNVARLSSARRRLIANSCRQTISIRIIRSSTTSDFGSEVTHALPP